MVRRLAFVKIAAWVGKIAPKPSTAVPIVALRAAHIASGWRKWRAHDKRLWAPDVTQAPQNHRKPLGHKATQNVEMDQHALTSAT